MAIGQAEKGKRFRALHEGPGTFVIPNPSNAGTARILTALGFKALATTSAGVAFSLGRRDGAGLVSREETLEHAREIVEASDLPVSADLEKCFGDEPEIVAETIRKAAAVGLVGGSVEDASGDPDRAIYDHVLAVERVAAAVATARATAGRSRPARPARAVRQGEPQGMRASRPANRFVGPCGSRGLRRRSPTRRYQSPAFPAQARAPSAAARRPRCVGASGRAGGR